VDLKIKKEKFYELSVKISELKITSEKDIQRLEQLNEGLNQKIDALKSEIWELKNHGKSISQAEKDIAVLSEQSIGNKDLLISFKNELEAKMVTKTELNDKKYKDWRLWLSILAIIIAVGMNFDKVLNLISHSSTQNTSTKSK
jgi:tRNA/tmRNA/rRNA uracil-C5-methylase (TrmA/RlmC/RlmD family)